MQTLKDGMPQALEVGKIKASKAGVCATNELQLYEQHELHGHQNHQRMICISANSQTNAKLARSTIESVDFAHQKAWEAAACFVQMQYRHGDLRPA